MVRRRVVLSFPKETVEEPVTYHLIKDYDLMVNILSAKVNPNEEGRLVIEISGREEALDRGMEYLRRLGVGIQPLAQEVRFDGERCTHCSVCIPLCPSGALGIDRVQMKVSFDPEHCILCGLCLKACPYQAVEILF